MILWTPSKPLLTVKVKIINTFHRSHIRAIILHNITYPRHNTMVTIWPSNVPLPQLCHWHALAKKLGNNGQLLSSKHSSHYSYVQSLASGRHFCPQMWNRSEEWKPHLQKQFFSYKKWVQANTGRVRIFSKYTIHYTVNRLRSFPSSGYLGI